MSFCYKCELETNELTECDKCHRNAGCDDHMNAREVRNGRAQIYVVKFLCDDCCPNPDQRVVLSFFIPIINQ